MWPPSVNVNLLQSNGPPFPGQLSEMFSSGTFSKFSQALKEKFYSSFSNDMPEWSCHYSKTCIVFHSNSFYTGNHYHPLSQSAHYSVDSGPRPHKTRWLASCIFPYFSINALTEEKNPISSLPYSIPIIIKKKKKLFGDQMLLCTCKGIRILHSGGRPEATDYRSGPGKVHQEHWFLPFLTSCEIHSRVWLSSPHSWSGNEVFQKTKIAIFLWRDFLKC